MHSVQRDKISGGYVMGQQIVFLLLVTPKITLPVGFAFYQPDPAWKVWQKEDKRLKKAGIAKIDRPPKPPRDSRYPTMQMIALELLRQFALNHPRVKIRCILADALYGTQAFMHTASKIFGGVQVISQIRSNQRITTRKRSQYIVVTDLTWRMTDIAQAYTLRWLVEVFFQDWKSYEGWCQLAKQPDIDGAYRGLLLSLLTDHSLFFHEEQKALLEHKLPACTVGSLRALIRFEALIALIREIISCDNLEEKLEDLLANVREFVRLRPSSKHMSSLVLGRMEQTPTLKYRARENA